MALVVEDGTGVTGAEAYASVAAADDYWSKRRQSPLADAWARADPGTKEGAMREGADYMDAELGLLYPGRPKARSQGKLCPRVDSCDPEFEGYPAQVAVANIELAARAVTSPLAPDRDSKGWVKREKTGPIETEYGGPGAQDGSYGAVFRSLSTWLIALPGASWNWA